MPLTVYQFYESGCNILYALTGRLFGNQNQWLFGELDLSVVLSELPPYLLRQLVMSRKNGILLCLTRTVQRMSKCRSYQVVKTTPLRWYLSHRSVSTQCSKTQTYTALGTFFLNDSEISIRLLIISRWILLTIMFRI